jgi:hypothetical protein
MPSPRVLLLQELSEREGCLVLGYAADGRFSRDTWYPSPDEARQAEREDFGSDLSEWRLCETDELDNAVIAALRYAKDVN